MIQYHCDLYPPPYGYWVQIKVNPIRYALVVFIQKAFNRGIVLSFDTVCFCCSIYAHDFLPDHSFFLSQHLGMAQMIHFPRKNYVNMDGWNAKRTYTPNKVCWNTKQVSNRRHRYKSETQQPVEFACSIMFIISKKGWLNT